MKCFTDYSLILGTFSQNTLYGKIGPLYNG